MPARIAQTRRAVPLVPDASQIHWVPSTAAAISPDMNTTEAAIPRTDEHQSDQPISNVVGRKPKGNMK